MQRWFAALLIGVALYLQHIHDVTWREWLTVPITFLFTNMFEWAVHRFVMHGWGWGWHRSHHEPGPGALDVA